MLDKQDQMIHLQQDNVDEVKGLRRDSARIQQVILKKNFVKLRKN